MPIIDLEEAPVLKKPCASEVLRAIFAAEDEGGAPVEPVTIAYPSKIV